MKELLNQSVSGIQLVFRCHVCLLDCILALYYSEFVLNRLIKQLLSLLARYSW